MERLKFLETVTVNEFKTQKGVNKIEIKRKRLGDAIFSILIFPFSFAS